MATMRDVVSNEHFRCQAQRTGEFFKKLSPAAFKDLESLAIPLLYQPDMLYSLRRTRPGASSWLSRAK